MFKYTYNKRGENKRGAEAPLLVHMLVKNYFLTKKDITTSNTTSPVNPPLPKSFTKVVRLAITSTPKTDPAVKTNQRIDTGITAINTDPTPAKNPVIIFITFSIFSFFLINTCLKFVRQT